LYIILIIVAYDNNVVHIYNEIDKFLVVIENFARKLAGGDVRTLLSAEMGESFGKKILQRLCVVRF